MHAQDVHEQVEVLLKQAGSVGVHQGDSSRQPQGPASIFVRVARGRYDVLFRQPRQCAGADHSRWRLGCVGS